MISSDDHSPPDPQKSNDFKIHSDDQKAHASVSASDFDLDLFKSLVAHLNDTNNPLPKFSIRDYVFNSRSKDIACNWPFSHKTLQNCLQHGVKNLLPPFQSPESLRDNSPIENRQSDEEIVIGSDGKPIVDDFVLVTSYDAKSNPELKCESTNTSSSRSKGDKESLTHLQEDLAHIKLKKTSLVSSRKTEDAIVKKCRLGAKLNTGVEPVEEATPNNFIVSETMASKVCPVCKTFSSSSNTTLNAHIDQCLSGESSMKWTANPKVIIKHKIKPRKTRLMVDIYETAPHCTVEELDARNGTSWANNSSFPAQELEFQGEEEKQERRATTVFPEVADHEGAVYIDTNGTKVRILSVPKVGTSDDIGAQKLQKRGKLSKLFMEKKKNKNHEQKHQQKYLKLSPNSKKFCSPKPNHEASCEVPSGREENTGKEPMNPEMRKKMNDLPIVRPPWACSKRTGLAKKVHGNSLLANNATKNSSVASDKSFSNCVSRSPPNVSTTMGTSSQHNSRKIGTLSPYKEQPSRAKEFSPLGHYAKKRTPLLTKPSSKHLKKEGTPLHDSCEDPLDACPSKGFKESDVKSKGSNFLSSGKKLSSVSREPAPKFSLKRKFSALKRSRVHPLSKQNVVVVSPSQDSLKQQSMAEEGTSERMSSDSMNMSLLEVRKKDETKIRRQENYVALRSSNGDSSAWLKAADIADPSCDVESVRKESQAQKEQISTMQDAQVIDVVGSSMALSNSLNPDNMFDLQEHANDKEMYCADFNEKTVHIDDVTNDIKKQQNHFPEVDPIPLPEPLGSFLPSPGREITISEGFQRNSSFANTSMVQSNEDKNHHDTMDQDSMSESPISTISNPSLARSDSDKLSIRSTSLKDDTRGGFSGAMVDAMNEKYAHVTSANAGDWRSAPTFFMDKGPNIGFKNDQPCCCSRKEGASSQNIASSYHQSTLLRKHTAESLNSRPQMFSISNYPTSPSPPVASPTMKLPAYSECDSVGSPSKPVLRLMGKNLTVADDVSSSQQFKPPPPMAHFPNFQSEYKISSIGYHPQHSIIFNHNQNGFKSQHPNNLWSGHQLDTMFPSTSSYMDRYSHGSPMIASQDRNRFDGQMVMSERKMHKAASNSNPVKEVILIDDSPEHEGGNDDMRTWACFSSSNIPSNHNHNHNHMVSGYPFENGSLERCLSFREAAGSSRSTSHLRSSATAMYYPRS